MSRIIDTLLGWNGREVASLTRLVTSGPPSPSEMETLLDLVALGDKRKQNGATWLLLAWARSGHPPTERQTTRLIGYLSRLADWQAVLHSCQLLRYLRWESSHRAALDHFVARAVTSSRSFVRAWAWDAWAVIHRDDPNFVACLEAGTRGETASVRARVRALLRDR